MKNGKRSENPGTPPNYEVRSAPGTVEVRESAEGGSIIRGIAAVFDSLSENLGGFREIISNKAFDEANMDDVRGLFNHDTNYILGRTASKTVRLEITKRGLEYEIDLPNTQTIRDLVLEPIKRGDVSQSSFGFIVARGGDTWDEDDEGVLIRTITGFRELFDVSPVVFPAYRDTTVAARSMNSFLEKRERHAAEIEQHAKRGSWLDRVERVTGFSGHLSDLK